MNHYTSSQTHIAYGRVAVLMGGCSAEREISLQTGQAVYDALCRQSVDAERIDTAEGGVEKLLKGNFDRVFIALHGRGGEDGTIQGVLDSMALPYTGSGVLGSALAMDKVRSKWIWQSHGLATPEFVELTDEQTLDEAALTVGFPMMVKPVQEGSSCGAGKAVDKGTLRQAWLTASGFDPQVMAERWIDGVEYTVGILAGRALPAIRLETPREFYDYEAKYVEETTQYICPCGLEPEQERQMADLCVKAFELVGASGWGRVDLMVDDSGTPWLIEVNTIPGMTSHSLVPMAAKQAGMEFDELVLQILNTSMVEAKIEQRLVS